MQHCLGGCAVHIVASGHAVTVARIEHPPFLAAASLHKAKARVLIAYHYRKHSRLSALRTLISRQLLNGAGEYFREFPVKAYVILEDECAVKSPAHYLFVYEQMLQRA